MSRTAVAILSTENLLHNISVIKSKVGETKIIAMVKANAYGHGIRSVASRIDKHVDILGVASIDEALALRKIGVKAPIMLAEGVFEAGELLIAAAENFEVVFHNPMQIEWLEKSSLPLPLHSWIKVNTGMGRLGFSIEECAQYYDKLNSLEQVVKPIKVMSHFACSDELEHPLNNQQILAFKGIIAELKGEFSICNSAAIFHFPECHYDYVRPGLAIYGVSPINNVSAESLGLKPVMTVQSNLISVKMMPKGSYIGYGARYCCAEDMLVGVIAFGYGDGYPITAKDGTPILVNKKKCALIGRVSMDMMMVDLRECQDAKVGDAVILWGHGLPIEEVAHYTNNITYDMLCGIQHRVKFIWTQGERNG